ncbi:MAG: hypothetical protein ACD_58C00244G0001 [uncultured bacterium]|nr:MAG: hypothetical protein ACD_58C00244G0001 [uncultured bacterium]
MRWFLVWLFALLLLLEPISATALTSSYLNRNHETPAPAKKRAYIWQKTYQIVEEFMVTPPPNMVVPSNMPIIVVGPYPKGNIRVELWDVTGGKQFFFKNISQCYYNESGKENLVFQNLELKNSRTYEVRIINRQDRTVMVRYKIYVVDNDDKYIGQFD